MKYVLMIAAIVAGAAAAADPVTLYTGKKGGGYDGSAQTVAKRLAQRGVDVGIENRAGSDDITLQACADNLSVWWAQIDAIWTREMKDGCYLPVLAEYGTEMATIWFPPDSRAGDLGDLDETSTVFVTDVGSGSELWWRTAVAIEAEHGRGDDWSKATVENGDLRRVNALASRGNVDAVILVRTSNSADFERMIDSGWQLGSLKDKDLDDLTYGDRPLYAGTRLTLQFGKAKAKGYAYEVRSFIGTTEAVERDDPDLFDAMLSALE